MMEWIAKECKRAKRLGREAPCWEGALKFELGSHPAEQNRQVLQDINLLADFLYKTQASLG